MTAAALAAAAAAAASAAARPLLVVLTGPTGSGKSELALRLAERLGSAVPLEIISADSALMYRGMDIGTAKPSGEARARVAHHLIDIRDPAQSYSAGEFVHDARRAIAAIHARGRLPLLVGGTMLYLRALREGLAALPPASQTLRQELSAQAARVGWPSLHAELARVDPEAAARIARNDAQRVQRALEVYRLTGEPISHWQRHTQGAKHDYRWLRYAALPNSRVALRQHLALRFRGMLACGLVDEVRALYQRGDLSEQHASMRAVGYRQLWQFCAGRVSLAEASDQAVIATAQLAKRQLTWLRAEHGLIGLTAHDPAAVETLAASIRAAARAAGNAAVT